VLEFDGAVEHPFGDSSAVSGLLTGEPDSAQLGVIEGQELVGSDLVDRPFETAVGGVGGGQRYLLLEDEPDQRGEPGRA
jgi:hypothetical protein